MSQSKSDRRRDTAIAGTGGALVYGGHAAPSMERTARRFAVASTDRKITRLKRSMPKGTPVSRRNRTDTGYQASATPEQKAARKVRNKKVTGQLNELQGKKKRLLKPKLTGSTKSKLVYGTTIVGAPMVVHGVRNQFEKRDFKRRDADVALASGAAGAGGYQLASNALKPLDRKAERKITEDPKLAHIQRQYQKEKRPKAAKKGDPAWRPYFRNYPKELPGARMKRTLAVTHTGKTGTALTLGVGGAAAAGGALASRKHREVTKSMTTSAFGVDHA